MNCTAGDEGVHKPDSAVHRYDRVHGFEVSDRERGLIAADERLAEAALQMRNHNRMISHPEVVYRWSLFERYCMEFFPDNTWLSARRLAMGLETRLKSGESRGGGMDWGR